MGDGDGAGAVAAAVADAGDGVAEGDVEEAGEDEEAGYVLCSCGEWSASALQSCGDSQTHRDKRAVHEKSPWA